MSGCPSLGSLVIYSFSGLCVLSLGRSLWYNWLGGAEHFTDSSRQLSTSGTVHRDLDQEQHVERMS